MVRRLYESLDDAGQRRRSRKPSPTRLGELDVDRFRAKYGQRPTKEPRRRPDQPEPVLSGGMVHPADLRPILEKFVPEPRAGVDRQHAMSFPQPCRSRSGRGE